MTAADTSFWEDVYADLFPKPNPYLQNSTGWLEDVLGEHLWSKQVEIMQSVRDNEQTAVQACHGPGKSFLAARIAAWWIDVHPPGTAKVLTSAPTFDQVKSILWGELNKAHAKGNLIGNMNLTEWYIGKERVAFGRKPKDPSKSGPDDTVQSFQGEHADYLLIIFDEACGIPKPLWLAALSQLTNDESRILAIGNPDDPDSHFASVCEPGSGWNVVRIPLFETPRFTGEQVHESVWKRMPTEGWLRRFIKEFGDEGTNAYKAKVLAEFPETKLDGIIPWSYVLRGKLAEPDPTGLVALGFDVAGSMNGDESVIREFRGNVPGRTWKRRTDQSEELVDLALLAILESGATEIKVDAIGVGFGVGGHLRRELKNMNSKCRVVMVSVGERSDQPKRFKNLRSQIWWEVGREAINDGSICLAEIDDETLGELVAPKYHKNSVGQIVVEPKEDTKQRLGRSPDNADAFLLARYVGRHGTGRTTGRQVADARVNV